MAQAKFKRNQGEKVTEIEEQVAQILTDLEGAVPDLKVLKELSLVSVKEINLSTGKQAVVIFVPFRQHSTFQRIQEKLVRELEKKLGKHVVIIAQRKILKKPAKKNHVKMQKRPHSRTLTAVHEAILDDMVFPADIVGKRIRYKSDGGKQIKVFIDNSKSSAEYKLETFASIYKDLTGKDAVFKFPPQKQNQSISGKDLSHK